MSYLCTGSVNGIKLQVWATWLFYAVLVDLVDAVADELSLPFDRISFEMIYRGLYHFSVAYDKGKADDPIKYFAASENQDLGVVKSLRKPVYKLDLSPFPAHSRQMCNSLNLSRMVPDGGSPIRNCRKGSLT